MNRAFLIIFVPAALVAAAFFGAAAYLGVRLNPLRFIGAGAIFLAAIVILHRRSKARPSGR